MSRNLYTEVSARILSQLEAGAAPWVKPWSATPGQNMPHNAATNRPYSGANVILLWMAQRHYATPRYLTFKQAKSLGGNVKKGEHGTKVYFVKPMVKKPTDETSDPKTFTMLREYTVFNVEQCEGLPERIVTPQPIKPRHNGERDATIEEFIATTGCDYRDGKGGDRAFYSSGGDFVAMPTFQSFKSTASYYATAFHELGHWTGHKSRLDREFGKRFGDKAYAAEELVAELTSAFLCAEFALDGELRHAGYIGNWIELLKHDARAFFTAASKAQAAADFLRNTALQDNEPQEDEPLALAA
jgi:antirestriction protein ArdC